MSSPTKASITNPTQLDSSEVMELSAFVMIAVVMAASNNESSLLT